MVALKKTEIDWRQESLSRALRESARWHVLVTLDAARPEWLNEAVLFASFSSGWPGVTSAFLRRELDYLQLRKLISLNQDSPSLLLKLTREGIDLVEYTVDCEPGIARPPL